jgi:hypothetical protein
LFGRYSNLVFDLTSSKVNWLFFGGHIFSTNHRNRNGNKLCPSHCRSFTVFLRSIYSTKHLRDNGITETNVLINLTFRHIDYVLSINNPNFANWISFVYSQRTRDERNNRNSFICLIYWHFPQIWHQWSSMVWISYFIIHNIKLRYFSLPLIRCLTSFH